MENRYIISIYKKHWEKKKKHAILKFEIVYLYK